MTGMQFPILDPGCYTLATFGETRPAKVTRAISGYDVAAVTANAIGRGGERLVANVELVAAVGV
ncbi:MAG TPA: hypothetical protein VGU71_01820 [Candidatus Dormibacteraeota bacterium]|nr:hypothetical protein [Candidatus Dormibacteraeota bacterium]